jgi:hypothetical protein
VVVVESRVARWYIFKPIIPILANFESLGMENFGTFYGHLEYTHCGHLVYFRAIW